MKGSVDQLASSLKLFQLDGQSIVVTGASSGLGRRFARVLAGAGATVYAAARRLDRLAEVAASTPGIHPVACDVTSEADRRALIDRVIAETGRIDVLVNNAGVGGSSHAERESPAEFAAVLDVNVLAAFHLSTLAAGPMRAGGSGAIVNVTSILGLVSGAPLGGAGYSASKGALVALTRELAGQWGRSGIRVNALAPGWFRTEMTDDLFADDRASAWVARNTMMNRAGESGELDGALLFLSSSASSYCTGQVVVIDGGWTAR